MAPRAEKGITVGEQGRRWVESKIGRLLLQPPERIIRIIPKADEEILHFPPLAKGDERPYTIRFNPSNGRIYVPTWKEATLRQEGDQRFLANPERYTQLRHPREHQLDLLTNLRGRRKVVALIHEETDNLEAAIRQQEHIMENYREGKEATQVRQIMNWLEFQLQAILGGKINRDRLDGLAEATAKFLEESGLSKAKVKAKERISVALTKAAQVDALGRINPLLMGVEFRSALLNAVEREVMPALVDRKFAGFFGILLMDRIVTRETMQRTVEDLRGITQEGGVLSKEPTEVSIIEKEGLKMILEKTANSLGIRGRVLPYLPSARVAGINLKGCRPHLQENNRAIMGDELADTLFKNKPVIQLVGEGDFNTARERIDLLSCAPLRTVLDANKEIGIENR